MSDFKIGPPSGIGQSQVSGAERASPTEGEKSFQLAEEVAATGEPPSTAATNPATLVQQIRDGQLDIEQAVEVLIDGALQAQPMAEASEDLRRMIRNTLIDLINDDPTLAALASALKR